MLSNVNIINTVTRWALCSVIPQKGGRVLPPSIVAHFLWCGHWSIMSFDVVVFSILPPLCCGRNTAYVAIFMVCTVIITAIVLVWYHILLILVSGSSIIKYCRYSMLWQLTQTVIRILIIHIKSFTGEYFNCITFQAQQKRCKIPSQSPYANAKA